MRSKKAVEGIVGNIVDSLCAYLAQDVRSMSIQMPQFTGHDVVNFGSGGSWPFDAGYSENGWASFPTERHKVGTRSLSARDSRDPKTRSFLTDLFAVYCCGPHSLAENLCFSELSRLQCQVLHNGVDILTKASIF